MPLLGAHARVVRQAQEDREVILRTVDSLPKTDRELVTDVIPTAEALYRRIQALAFSLAELERSAAVSAAEDVEAQIARLEAEANPLDRSSEDRVRRLAYLKRQRRALADQVKRREEGRAKLESCALALSNMRLEVVRLRAGSISNSLDQITLLTERARSLGEDVDAAVYGADEVRKLTRGTRDSALGTRHGSTGATAPRESQ
jgi:serine/threonine-protein kinase